MRAMKEGDWVAYSTCFPGVASIGNHQGDECGASRSRCLVVVPKIGEPSVESTANSFCEWMANSLPRSMFVEVVRKIGHRDDCPWHVDPTVLHFNMIPVSVDKLLDPSFVRCSAEKFIEDLAYVGSDLHRSLVDRLKGYWQRWNDLVATLRSGDPSSKRGYVELIRAIGARSTLSVLDEFSVRA